MDSHASFTRIASAYPTSDDCCSTHGESIDNDLGKLHRLGAKANGGQRGRTKMADHDRVHQTHGGHEGLLQEDWPGKTDHGEGKARFCEV
jgi:hypothetical protein